MLRGRLRERLRELAETVAQANEEKKETSETRGRRRPLNHDDLLPSTNSAYRRRAASRH